MSKLVRGKDDSIDRLVLFLAKRDGIDKLVKTFQYIFKLLHWRALQHKNTELAKRAKMFEDSCGLSRKAFRTGRFLTGFNNLRRNRSTDWKISALTLLGSSGEMVYFFFDHFTWMSRVGLLDSKLAARFAFISAYGETFLYISFITLDLMAINRDLVTEEKLTEKLHKIEEKLPLTPIFTPYKAAQDSNSNSGTTTNGDSQERHPLHPLQDLQLQAEELREAIRVIQAQRVNRSLSIAAQLADLLIAVAIIEPRPLWCHPLSLGISGLVSAWSGWYRLWPA